jgi:Skp family chaperone for outer membrane proteins
MKTFARLIPVLLLAAAALPSEAMEIPLERGGPKASKRGLVVGFVDMDRIYQEYPETRKARKEYQEQADKMKGLLADKEAELSDLREQLSVLKAAQAVSASTQAVSASTAAVAFSTPTAFTSGNLSQKEGELAEQEASLTEARKSAVQALSEFERKRAAQIFGKLYKSLVQLADEKGVDVVLEKSALLYGQAGLDLTDALSRRVRGLPDDAEEEKP